MDYGPLYGQQIVTAREKHYFTITIIVAASEASSDTILDDSRTTRAPADGKSPVPADIIGNQTKVLWAGHLRKLQNGGRRLSGQTK